MKSKFSNFSISIFCFLFSFFIFTCHAELVSASQLATTKSPSIKILSPKPGEKASGTIIVKFNLTYHSERSEESPILASSTINLYIDFKLVEIIKGSDVEEDSASNSTNNEQRTTNYFFTFDTTKFENGRHLLTLNFIDEKKKIYVGNLYLNIKN